MNKIFEQVDRYMHEALKKGLPDIKPCELEKDEAVFYMNGKNGTAFDWYVNEHFPNFFIFYNDTENLGAVKATLYTDGGLTIYVYGEKGHAEPVTFEEQVEATAEELLDLAVMLTENADSKRIRDDDIRILLAGLHKLLVHRFYRMQILVNDALQAPATLLHVSCDTSQDAYVCIGVHINFNIHQRA